MRHIALYIRLLFCLFGLFLTPTSSAFEVYKDAGRGLSYQEVKALPDSAFIATETGYLGFSDARFWVRINLENLSDKAVNRFVHFEEPMQRTVTAYMDVDGVTSTLQSGYKIPVGERQISTSQIVFEFELPALSSNTLYFAFEGDAALTAEHQIYSEVEWFERYQTLLIVASAMLAAYLVLVFYNGFLAISTNDIVYRYYLLILVGALISLGSKHAVPSYSDSLASLTGHIHSLGGVIAYAATPLFFRAFFAELNSPAIRLISSASFIGVMLFIPALLIENSWALKIYSEYWVGFLFVLFWWGMLAVAIKQQHPLWKVVVIGWTPVTLGTPLYVAYLNGWLPASFRTAAETSSLYEAFIFSIALAYRLKMKDRVIAAASARLALQSEHIVEIERHEAELENAVSRLTDSERELRAEKAKQEQLFSIIGHELRTPASALQMLLQDQGVDKLQPHGSVIDDTVKHLLNVLDDMRIVTQPDLVLESPEVKGQVPTIVERCLPLVEGLTAERGLEVRLHASDEAKAVSVVREQLLRQIVLNLVKNCALHANASKLEIRIDAIDRSDSLLFMLMFSDNGRGIRPDHQAKIFEAFERSDSESDGTGLGLHISRTYARNIFKGDLTYRDNDGGGALFTLTALFPKTSQKLEEAQASQVEIEQSNVLQGLKILYAEDSAVLRMMTTKQLEKQGAQVIAAVDGREALNRAANEHFDLLLTDIFMPEVDGYALTRAIREQGFEGPIFGASAAVVGEEVDALKRAGAIEVMPKPFEINAFKALVAMHL